MKSQMFCSIVDIAGLAMKFDASVFEELPIELKKSYEIHKSLRHEDRDGVRIEMNRVKKLPSLFFKGMKDCGRNKLYKRLQDVEYYCFRDRNGTIGPVAFSYGIRKRLCVLYLTYGYKERPIQPLFGRLFLHPLFNGFYDIALYSAILLHHQGFLIHGAGFFKRDCGGVLVCGHSGEGKSTLAQKLNDLGYDVISDDSIVIRETYNGFLFFSTPWRWKNNPLKHTDGILFSSIFFLTKYNGKCSQIRPLSKREVFLNLCEYCFSFREKTPLCLELCSKIAAEVKGFQLLHTLEDNRDPIKLL